MKLEQCGDEEFFVEDENKRVKQTIDGYEQELKQIEREHNFEKLYQRSYYHMLDRMKKDLVAFQINSNDLADSYKQKQQI